MEQLRVIVAAGLLMLLLLLRLEAEEFGAAEYAEPARGRRRSFTLRLSWYLLGFCLLAAIYLIHPQPHDVLYLVLGHREEALAYGALLGLLGALQAVAFAMYRYRDLRLPDASAYPNGAINAIGTAIVDEATFRGILMGMLIATGLQPGLAVVVQAVLYALATRLGAKGGHPYMLLLALGIGLLGGWATVETQGIGAAIFGHGVATFALFVTTGHAGQVARRGREPEEVERIRRPPSGWRDARPAARALQGPRTYTDRGSELPEPREPFEPPETAVRDASARRLRGAAGRPAADTSGDLPEPRGLDPGERPAPRGDERTS